MDHEIATLFLNFSVEKLSTFSSRIDDCLGRLNENQIWNRGSESENSVGNLVLHLCGNVRQWIISAIGGKLDVRNRDAEFAAREGPDRAALRRLLKETITEATEVLRSLEHEQLVHTITTWGNEYTVLTAIYHVVEHFAQHTGQIMYATKMLTQQDLGYFRHLHNKTR